MRGAGGCTVALLVCCNPRDRLKNPAVSVPRVFATRYSKKIYRFRDMVVGRSRIV